jgi:hypothetical protein
MNFFLTDPGCDKSTPDLTDQSRLWRIYPGCDTSIPAVILQSRMRHFNPGCDISVHVFGGAAFCARLLKSSSANGASVTGNAALCSSLSHIPPPPPPSKVHAKWPLQWILDGLGPGATRHLGHGRQLIVPVKISIPVLRCFQFMKPGFRYSKNKRFSQ